MKKNKSKNIEFYREDFYRYEKKEAVRKKVKFYSLNTAFTIIFILAAVLINVFFGILSDKVNLRFDLTGNKLFTLSETSKELISSLSSSGKSIELIVCADEETVKKSSSDTTGVSVYKYIYETLEEYSKAYEKITLHFVNPTYNPSFYKERGINLADGTDSSVTGSVVMAVYSPDTKRYKLIKSSAVSDKEYIGLEHRVSAAVSFVSKDNLQTVGIITGHGETEVPYFELLLGDNGYVTEYITLSDYEKIPEKYAFLIDVCPTRTFDSLEISKIDEFLSNGEKLGKHFILCGDLSMSENPLLENYIKDEWGVSFVKKSVFDNDKNYVYSISSAKFLKVNFAEKDIAKDLVSKNSPLLLSYGLTTYLNREFSSRDNVKTAVLLQSSENSFSKDLVMYDSKKEYKKEDGDGEGPFDIGVLSEKSRYDGTKKITSDVVVFSTNSLFDGLFLSNVTGATSSSPEYALNLTKYLAASTESVDVDVLSVDLSGDKLNFENDLTFVLSFVFITVLLPLLFSVIGIIVYIKRKNR